MTAATADLEARVSRLEAWMGTLVRTLAGLGLCAGGRDKAATRWWIAGHIRVLPAIHHRLRPGVQATAWDAQRCSALVRVGGDVVRVGDRQVQVLEERAGR